MARSRRPDAVLVVGLGRFGTAVASALMQLGHEVLAVDSDGRVVQASADAYTQAVEADAGDSEALRQLGAGEFRQAVVAIGDLEASVLTVTALLDAGVAQVWAKALTATHARILRRVGAHQVVLPEAEMGERLAHRLAGGLVDYAALECGQALAEVPAPPGLVGRSVTTASLAAEHGVLVVAVGRSGTHQPPGDGTVLVVGDTLVVAGSTADVDRFAP